MNIYVGNLSYSTTDESLKQAFSAFGEVVSAKIIKDMATGSSKGFGFVQMATAQEAQVAVESLNGTDLDGRTLRVSEARQKPEGGPSRRPGGNGGPSRDGGYRSFSKPRRNNF